MADNFEIRQCTNPECGLRYPLVNDHPFGVRCPRCLGETLSIHQKELIKENHKFPHFRHLPISGLLDNVRSTWNVGAIFRTADGFDLEKLFLCGITSTPDKSSLRKTALGAQNIIPWEYHSNAVTQVTHLKKTGYKIFALEQDERAVSIYSISNIEPNPVVLIVGNEISGIDPGLLDLSDQILHIPMLGTKKSLNVEVAFGIALSILHERMESQSSRN